MINRPSPFKGLSIRIPTIIPCKGRGFINDGSRLLRLVCGTANYLVPACVLPSTGTTIMMEIQLPQQLGATVAMQSYHQKTVDASDNGTSNGSSNEKRCSRSCTDHTLHPKNTPNPLQGQWDVVSR